MFRACLNKKNNKVHKKTSRNRNSSNFVHEFASLPTNFFKKNYCFLDESELDKNKTSNRDENLKKHSLSTLEFSSNEEVYLILKINIIVENSYFSSNYFYFIKKKSL